jgi:glycosyltransferase involved in cell wall biosynthesis
VSTRRLAYLSGAPRVSTGSAAAAGGARSHILGVIAAFERAGWKVDRFIAGDRLGRLKGRPGRAAVGGGGRLSPYAADASRLIAGSLNGWLVHQALTPETTWAYERFASMQALGRTAKRRGIPWILETQGLFFREASVERQSMKMTGIARRIELGAYRDCDALVCVSEDLKRMVVAERVDPAKVLVVPNGVDPQFFDPESTNAIRLTDPGTLTIGFVGGLAYWQGLDALFRSLSEGLEELREVAVVVVGDGLARREWEDLADKLGLSEVVHWVGRVPRDLIPRYLKGFDMGFSGQIASKSAVMYHSPLKLYEYQAMGLPILASAYADAESLLGMTGAGVLFEPSRHASLTEALIQAAQGVRECRWDGRETRKRVVEAHSWERRVTDLIRGVNRILGTSAESS